MTKSFFTTTLILFLLYFLGLKNTCHGQFYMAYHQSFLKYNMKGLSYDFFEFNNTGEGHTEYLRPGSFKGIAFGMFGDITENFSYGMAIRTRRYTTVGRREIAPVTKPTYYAIRVRNTAFTTSIGYTLNPITFGYEIEIGGLRVLEKKEETADWRKLTDNRIPVGSLGLFFLIRPEFTEQFRGFIKGYWRPAFGNSPLYGNDFMERSRFMRLGQVGLEIGFNIANEL